MKTLSKSTLIICFAFASCLIASAAFAAFEDIGVGARGRGFGGAFRAVADDASSIYWNPAGLSQARRKELTAFYQDLYGLGLVNYNSIGYVMPRVGKGTLGFAWTRLGTSPQVSIMNYSENTYTFSYGQYIGGKISLGANLKYYSVLYDYKASGVGLDIAANYDAIKDKLRFAFVWDNINNPAIYWETLAMDNIPSKLHLAAAYRFNPSNILAVEAEKTIDKKVVYSAGYETWFFNKSLGFRAGFKEQDGSFNNDIGMSIGFNKVRIDYTLERHYMLGYSSLIGLSIEF